MNKPLLVILMTAALSCVAFCQQQKSGTPAKGPAGGSTQKAPDAEKYEAVKSADYQVDMKLSGRVSWDDEGRANGGPVEELTFGGHKVELADKTIKDGILATKDYGKIMIKTSPDFTFQLS